MARQAAPKNETPAQKFTRLAESRMRKAIKAINVVGNLSGPGYASTPEQTGKMIDALTKAVTEVEYRLGGDGDKANEGFTF